MSDPDFNVYLINVFFIIYMLFAFYHVLKVGDLHFMKPTNFSLMHCINPWHAIG